MIMDYKACNCAGCHVELIGDSNPEYIRSILLRQGKLAVAGRINSRPYCSRCFRLKKLKAVKHQLYFFN